MEFINEKISSRSTKDKPDTQSMYTEITRILWNNLSAARGNSSTISLFAGMSSISISLSALSEGRRASERSERRMSEGRRISRKGGEEEVSFSKTQGNILPLL